MHATWLSPLLSTLQYVAVCCTGSECTHHSFRPVPVELAVVCSIKHTGLFILRLIAELHLDDRAVLLLCLFVFITLCV
jgi:hypothetical protein